MKLIPRSKDNEGYTACEELLEKIRSDIFMDKELSMNKDCMDELIIWLDRNGYSKFEEEG